MRESWLKPEPSPTREPRPACTMKDPIFDDRLATLRVERAAHMARDGANFLSEMAMHEMADRLSVTNREFLRCMIISHDPASVGILRSRLPANAAGMEISLLSPADLLTTGDIFPGDETTDLFISPFGLHRINDLPGALARLRRALKPDGLLMAALPGEGSFQELRDCLILAESAQVGGAAMRVEPFIDIRQAGGLLQRAGFSLPVTDMEKLVLRYRSPMALVSELRAMGSTSCMSTSRRRISRTIWAKTEACYGSKYGDDDGRIRASLNIVYLTGWAPHENQQKPLRPGSAQTSLKSVL